MKRWFLWISTAVAVLLLGCEPQHGAPAKLVFLVQPTSAQNDTPLSPAVQVAVQDAEGHTVTTATHAITLSLGDNPADGTLGGELTATASNGVATFPKVQLDRTGDGYTLVATAAGLSQATSTPFTITPGLIIGERAIHYITDTGVVEVPADLTTAQLGAYITDSEGGLVYYPGVGQADGSFSIAGVPTQPYLLRFGRDLLGTSARQVDLGIYMRGRPDVQRADANTRLNLDLSNLAPWKDNDELQLYSSNSGLLVARTPPHYVNGAPPTAGGTSLNATLDYTRFPDPILVNASRGDALQVVQLEEKLEPAAGILYKAAVASFGTSALTVTSGGTTPLSGTMTALPQNQHLSVNWKLDAQTPGSFGAYRTEVNPGQTLAVTGLSVNAIPDLSHGFYGGHPDLVIYSSMGADAEVDRVLSLTHGDPYPMTPKFANAYAVYGVRYMLPGADGSPTAGTLKFGLMQTLEKASTFQSEPLVPRISPPRNPQINGQSAFNDLNGVTASPTLSWSPPSLGTPTHYLVLIQELYVSGGQTVSGEVVARIHTSRTSVRVPEGVMMPGKHYFLTFRAANTPDHDVEQHPYGLSIPTWVADAMSGIVSP